MTNQAGGISTPCWPVEENYKAYVPKRVNEVFNLMGINVSEQSDRYPTAVRKASLYAQIRVEKLANCQCFEVVILFSINELFL